MSEMTDRSVEKPDEDRMSLKSNGRTPTKDDAKATLGLFNSLRRSVRRAVEKSPLSAVAKGSKVISRADSASSESSCSPVPLSPSE